MISVLRPAAASALLLALTAPLPTSDDRPLPDPQMFFEKVRARLTGNSALLSRYLHTETRRRQEVDHNGRVVDETVEVFEVTPGPEPEQTLRLQVTVDGQPLSQEERIRQKREFMAACARHRFERSRERPERRARRLEEAARQEADTMDDVFRVYDFRLVGRDVIDGEPVIEVSIQPRPGARTVTDIGGLMRSFAGTAWVSETDYEVVRVRMEAIESVTRGFGLIARLHEGAWLDARRTRLDDGAWVPASVRFSASGRIVLVRRFGIESVTEYSDFRRLDSTAMAARADECRPEGLD